MQCEFCGFANGEDDHRCLRCGRRTTGMVVAAPASYSGNNALALDPWLTQASLNDTQDLPPLLRGQDVSPHASFRQPAQNVIPFDQIPRPAVRIPVPQQNPSVQVSAPPARPTPPPQRKKAQAPAGTVAEQATLDFTSVAAAPPRTLTNGVPASNYCQRPVATVAHRFSAAVMDSAMILIGFFLFAAGAQVAGMALGAPEVLGSGKPFLMLMGAFLFIATAFYGVVWMFARRETAGMRMAGLELITFDNSPLDPVTRIIRIATTWLSIGSCGLGVIWAIADEEKLTWQDHISRSFPTFREGTDTLVKQNR